MKGDFYLCSKEYFASEMSKRKMSFKQVCSIGVREGTARTGGINNGEDCLLIRGNMFESGRILNAADRYVDKDSVIIRRPAC